MLLQKVEQFKHIEKDTYMKCLILMHPKYPKLWSQIKLHKQNNPIRPIMFFKNTLGETITKIINKNLPRLLNYKFEYSTSHRKELIDVLAEMQLTNDSLLVSFDVVNLYTNIPVEEYLIIFNENIKESNLTQKNANNRNNKGSSKSEFFHNQR